MNNALPSQYTTAYLPTKDMNVTQQTNEYDCGMNVYHITKAIIHNMIAKNNKTKK